MVSDGNAVRQRRSAKPDAAMADAQPDTDNTIAAPNGADADAAAAAGGVIGGRYLKDCVYGGLDGIITTFSVVSGVYGSQLSHGITLVLGFANLLADGLSMATGNYLGTSAERDFDARERARHSALIRSHPQQQRNAVRAIYARRGFAGADLERAVAVVTGDARVWLDELCPASADAQDDSTDAPAPTTPIGAATVTFVSFVAFGLVPLLVYVAALLLPSSWLHAAVSAYAQIATGAGAAAAATDLADASAAAAAATAAASSASAAAASLADGGGAAAVLSSAAVTALTQALLFRLTVALTGATAFALGWLKARVTGTNALVSGCQTLALSALASGVAWGVGAVLKGLCAEFDVVPVLSR